MTARASRWWPVARAIVAALVATIRAAPSADTPLLLEVVINGYPTGKIGSFVQRDSRPDLGGDPGLWAAPGELNELGLRAPAAAAAAADATGLVALASLAGVSWRLDGPTQTLYITAPAVSLTSTLLATGGRCPPRGALRERHWRAGQLRHGRYRGRGFTQHRRAVRCARLFALGGWSPPGC